MSNGKQTRNFEWFHNNCAKILSLHRLSKNRVRLVYQTASGMRFNAKGRTITDVFTKAVLQLARRERRLYAEA